MSALLYFGDIRVLPAREAIPVPQGLVCFQCRERFGPHDKGLVTPWEAADGLASCAFHLKCFALSAFGDNRHVGVFDSPALMALREFVRAAEKLNEQWDDSLNEGYPAALPSFDEFVDQLYQWLQKAQR